MTVDVRITDVDQQGREVWELLAPVTVRGVLIPVGSRSDGVSRPWYTAWIVQSKERRTLLPAFLHDTLLKRHALQIAFGMAVELNRRQIDREFYLALRDYRNGRLKSWAMWLAVRWQAVVTEAV